MAQVLYPAALAQIFKRIGCLGAVSFLAKVFVNMLIALFTIV